MFEEIKTSELAENDDIDEELFENQGAEVKHSQPVVVPPVEPSGRMIDDFLHENNGVNAYPEDQVMS